MCNCIVYAHISPSNKLYIGISHKTLKERSGNGANYYSLYFRNAIKKYGWDNFKHITLIENITWDMAIECEKYLIAKYQTNNPKYGYNLTNGGEGTFGYKHTSETKLKISKANKNKSISQEQRDKISKTLKHMYENNPDLKNSTSARMKKLWESDEYKEKLINSHLGYIMPQEQKDKIRKSNLGKTLSERSKQVLSEKVKLQHKLERQKGIKRKTFNKEVIQYNLSGDIIATYKSAKEASIQTNSNYTSLCDCCREKIKTCNGFIFRYK